MRLDWYFTAFVVFSMIIVGGVLIIDNINENYGLDLDSEDKFKTVYDQINQTYDLSQDTREKAIDTDVLGEDESWESMSKGSYTGSRLGIKESGKIVGAVSTALIEELSIPPFFFKALVTIIAILTTFAIIYLVMRFSPGSG